MDEATSKIEFENDGNGKKYKIEVICDSAIYVRKSKGHLSGLYYLVSWKSYLEEKITWEPTLAVLHLCKYINTFYCNHAEKQIANLPPINSDPPMARPIVKPKTEALSTKQKRSWLTKAKGASKRTKKSWTSSFLSRFCACFNNRQKIPSVT